MVLIWFIIYLQNSTIEKVVEGNILSEIDVGEKSKILIIEEENYIYAEPVRHTLLGWKKEGQSRPAVKNNQENQKFSTSNYSLTQLNNVGLIFGYFPPDVDFIRFQTNVLDIKHKRNSHYWFIKVDKSELNFNPQQFSVIYEDGKEVYYPFN